LTHYFSCSGGTGTDSRKSALSLITPNLCFASGGIFGSRSAFRCVRCVKHRHTIFHGRVGLVQIPEKVYWDTLTQTCVFASGRICESRSALPCVRDVRRRCTIFLARVGPVRNPQKTRGGTLHRTCVFCIRWYLWVTYCIRVSSGRVTSMHYFLCSGGYNTDSTKTGQDTLCQSCVFAFSGICRSRSAFRGAKHRRTIFHAWVGLV
jgi:hypothetical protein